MPQLQGVFLKSGAKITAFFLSAKIFKKKPHFFLTFIVLRQQ